MSLIGHKVVIPSIQVHFQIIYQKLNQNLLKEGEEVDHLEFASTAKKVAIWLRIVLKKEKLLAEEEVEDLETLIEMKNRRMIGEIKENQKNNPGVKLK